MVIWDSLGKMVVVQEYDHVIFENSTLDNNQKLITIPICVLFSVALIDHQGHPSLNVRLKSKLPIVIQSSCVSST